MVGCRQSNHTIANRPGYSREMYPPRSTRQIRTGANKWQRRKVRTVTVSTRMPHPIIVGGISSLGMSACSGANHCACLTLWPLSLCGMLVWYYPAAFAPSRAGVSAAYASARRPFSCLHSRSDTINNKPKYRRLGKTINSSAGLATTS